MALVRLLGAVPFLALVALGLSRPELTPSFWLMVATMLPWRSWPAPLYAGPAPLPPVAVRPFLAFTPVFLIFTGWLVLGERLNRWGVAGTVMIARVLRPGTGGRRRRPDRGPGAAEGPGPRARRPPDAHGGGHLLGDRRPV